MIFSFKRWVVILAFFLCLDLVANDVSISNVEFKNQNTTNDYIFIDFDLSWSNSWRSATNYDAIWIFVKYRMSSSTGGDETWRHATLHTSGHIAPSGSEIIADANGKGVFIQRDANGTGSINLLDIQLRWNYGMDDESSGDPIDDDDEADVSVIGIEMVYIPQAAFTVGTGGTSERAAFTNGSISSVPGSASVALSISSEGAMTVSNSSGNLWLTSDGFNPTSFNEICSSPPCTLPDNSGGSGYPKGYDAFYAMKHEVSQGQYAEFLNYLTSTQATERYPNEDGNNRHTISGTHPNFSASAPDRACNFLGWIDAAAFADWAALRPMTELEYEKVCRGDQTPIAGEYAFGDASNSIPALTSDGIFSDGTAAEASNTTGANIVVAGLLEDAGGVKGPLRSGWPAGGSRLDAGASYYGCLEMSGNVTEMVVSANEDGSVFTGSHGDGDLTTDGEADNSDWPGYEVGTTAVTDTDGAGLRGGNFNDPVDEVQAADRFFGSIGSDALGLARTLTRGFRAVKTQP